MRTQLRRFPTPIRTWLLALAAALFGMAAAHGYDITIEPVGHWHLFDAKTMTFQSRASTSSRGSTVRVPSA